MSPKRWPQVYENGLCRGRTDLAWGFRDEDQHGNDADDAECIAICRRCPVQEDCLEMALSDAPAHGQFGIYGGMSAKARTRLANSRRRANQPARIAARKGPERGPKKSPDEPEQHGTEAGYFLHRSRNGPPPCDACKAAHAAAEAGRAAVRP